MFKCKQVWSSVCLKGVNKVQTQKDPAAACRQPRGDQDQRRGKSCYTIMRRPKKKGLG